MCMTESWGLLPLNYLDQYLRRRIHGWNPMSSQNSIQSDTCNLACIYAHFSRERVPDFHLIFKVVYNPQKDIEMITLK